MAIVDNFARFSNSSAGQFAGRGLKESFGWVYDGKVNQGFLGLKGASFLGKVGGAVNLLMIAKDTIEGYQEDGISGAINKGAKATAFFAGSSMAMAAMGGPLTILAGLGIGAGVGGYSFGQAATANRKQLRRTEMTASNSSALASGAYTDRQRSLAALNNSSLNARMAIGNEAQYLHTSYSGISTYRR